MNVFPELLWRSRYFAGEIPSHPDMMLVNIIVTLLLAHSKYETASFH